MNDLDRGNNKNFDNEGKRYTDRYLSAFISEGSQALIKNVDTEFDVIDTGSIKFPVTINEEEYDNCYVCSPYNACVPYVQDETQKLNKPILEGLICCISNALACLLRGASINKIVSVNNWMLSTNLYPEWDGEELSKIVGEIVVKNPSHAVMFRSLNKFSNATLIDEFIRNKFIIIPSRQVYIYDNTSDYLQRHNNKIDFKLLENTQYTVINHSDIQSSDYHRIVELYNMLYLDKYSRHNPQFTQRCIEHWHKNNLIYFTGLRGTNGQLDGVVGFFKKNGIITAPVVGYDTSKDRRLGLYRMLMALTLKSSIEQKMVLNLSSGASEFKRMRGGQPYIEYSAVYVKHLPLGRRCVWYLMNFLLTYIGVPIIKRFKL